MDDNLTLESFLSLLDRSESLIMGDNLSEERVDYEYSISDKETKSASPAVAGDDVESCHDCNACFERSIYAYPILNKNPRILFVAPFPEGTSIFSEDAKAYFMKWLAAMGLKRSDIALTTLIKCPVRSFRKDAADACRKHLKNEMTTLRPEAMVLLGSETAEYMLRRSGDYSTLFRKKKFSVNSIPVFCTYSPSSLVRDRSLRAPIWEDLQFISSFLGGEKK